MLRASIFALLIAIPSLAVPPSARASDCDAPESDWLMCEDFEDAPLGWESWFEGSAFVECRGCSGDVNDPDRLFLSNDADHVYDGEWAMHMPARASAGYRGGELIFHTCVGEGRSGCDLVNHDRLYLRTRVKLAADHQYVHHFLSIGGTRPNAYWEGAGNAGCRPNGYRHAGTTLDFDRMHNLWFYTYHPEMRCDSGGYCSGSYAADICAGCADRDMPCTGTPECCWGNRFAPEEDSVIPRGEWTCLELMMEINTPGENDGVMAFWKDDVLQHEVTDMNWRDVPELGLNRANMSHYIAAGDAEQPNRVSFDDFIVSTSRIGCDMTPVRPDAGPGADGGGIDAGVMPPDGGPTDGGAFDTSSDAPGSDARGSDAGSSSVSGGCTAGGHGGDLGLLLLVLIARRRR